jgi:hypothetical protein
MNWVGFLLCLRIRGRVLISIFTRHRIDGEPGINRCLRCFWSPSYTCFERSANAGSYTCLTPINIRWAFVYGLLADVEATHGSAA